MNKLAVLLIATLLLGCTSPTKRVVAAAAVPVTPQSLQQLQVALRNAPIHLQQAVSQAGSERLRSSNSAGAINATSTANSSALLMDILTHTRDAVLLPDAAFEKLHKVVSGNNPPLDESYSAALAAYLTQSDFACQQPMYATYFQHRYAADEVVSTCSAQVPFSVLTQYEGAKTVWIYPKRVKSIHLLFASKSASMASRFGHVALRLVVCPDGKTASEDCDTNLCHAVSGMTKIMPTPGLCRVISIGSSLQCLL